MQSIISEDLITKLIKDTTTLTKSQDSSLMTVLKEHLETLKDSHQYKNANALLWASFELIHHKCITDEIQFLPEEKRFGPILESTIETPPQIQVSRDGGKTYHYIVTKQKFDKDKSFPHIKQAISMRNMLNFDFTTPDASIKNEIEKALEYKKGKFFDKNSIFNNELTEDDKNFLLTRYSYHKEDLQCKITEELLDINKMEESTKKIIGWFNTYTKMTVYIN